jgi:hypothetical protein
MTKKKMDRMVERAYYDTCSGIQINILNIGKVFDHGRQLLKDGADEDALKVGVRAFVETIREN